MTLYFMLLGCVVGSFLNVCIYRIPIKLSLRHPRSHCPSCKHPLGVMDLIPLISYITHFGKCKYCACKIPFHYPIVELLTGALWSFLFSIYCLSFPFFCYAIFFSIMIVVFFIDLKLMLIPNVLVLSLLIPAGAVVFYHFFSPLEIYGSSSPLAPLKGLMPGALFFLTIYIVAWVVYKNDRVIGMGDIKLYIPVGLILGLKQCIFSVFITILTGGICSIFLLLLGKKKRKDAIPLGPFIVIGSFISLIIPADVVLSYYWSFLFLSSVGSLIASNAN